MATNNTNNTNWLCSMGVLEGVSIRRPRREDTDSATIERHRAMEDDILHNHSSDWWAMVRASPRVKALHARRRKDQKEADAEDGWNEWADRVLSGV